jgi:hypothetical protein
MTDFSFRFKKPHSQPILSQRCLPGGPRSATYNISNYTYPSENTPVTMQPNIAALDGDTQVGVHSYGISSDDTNYNRGLYPSPHVITEKSFYTEIQPGPNSITDLYGPFAQGVQTIGQTFLRVDLTEGGTVFRHNAVMVKGSVFPATPRYVSSNDILNADINDPQAYSTMVLNSLVDFEFYFVCPPLHSNYSPEGTTPSEFAELDKLKTAYNCYFYIRNRSFGDDQLSDVSVEGVNYNFHSVLYGGNNPSQHWAEFALLSETNSDPNGLNVVSSIQRPKAGLASDGTTYVTPYNTLFSDDPEEKWDLNHVNFRLSFKPFLSSQPHRFAVKGTYLLI